MTPVVFILYWSVGVILNWFILYYANKKVHSATVNAYSYLLVVGYLLQETEDDSICKRFYIHHVYKPDVLQ